MSDNIIETGYQKQPRLKQYSFFKEPISLTTID